MYPTTIFMLTILFGVIHLENIGNFMRYLDEDFHFVENIGVYTYTTLGKCLLVCLGYDQCVYVGYDEPYRQCVLHGRNATFVSEGGGRAHYVRVTNVTGINNNRLTTGATAWQSTTYRDQTADKAIDGDFSQIFHLDGSCLHTHGHNSHWQMQFGMPGFVTSVDLYLRSDYNERNTNFTFLVSNSLDDVNDNIGTECGRYFGPVIDTSPYILSITCPRPIYGKFMRISHAFQDVMDFCEVVVHAL